MTEDNPAIIPQIVDRATALGLSEPRLPFQSLVMDGQPIMYFDREDGVFPTAAIDLENRLPLVGKMWSHQGVLEFVSADGSYHVARDVNANRAALETAGFTPHAQNGTFFVNGRRPAEPNYDTYLSILSTPQDKHEALIFAVRKGDLHKVQGTLADGADPKKARDYEYNTLLLEVAFRSQGIDSLEIAKQLIAAGEQPLEQLSRGAPLTFLAISHGDPNAKGKIDLVKSYIKTSDEIDKSQKVTLNGIIDHYGDALQAGHNQARDASETIARSWDMAGRHNLEPKEALSAAINYLQPLATPKTAPRFQEAIKNYDHLKFHTIDDLVNEFKTHVVLPQLLMDYHERMGIQISDDELLKLPPKDELVPDHVVFKSLFGGRSVDKLIGLNEAWHDTRVAFPDALKPLAAQGEWHTLGPEKVIPVQDQPGISIHNLTTSKELKAEGRELTHCVGGYSTKCTSGKSHIFSVKDADGNSLSTIEGEWNGRNFTIKQNHGFQNSEPVQAALDAGTWLKDQFESGDIKAQSQLGETAESRRKNTHPALIKDIGFEITQDNANAAFREFCDNKLRRGRDYDPTTGTFSIISRKTELIAGSININGDGKSFRDMSAKDWYQHSGMRDKVWEASPLKSIVDAELAKRALLAAAPTPANTSRDYSALNRAAHAAQHHLGNVAGLAGAAINLAQGDVAGAATDLTTTSTGLNAIGWGLNAAATAEKATPFLKLFGKAGIAILKRLPMIGAVTTAAIVVEKVGEHVVKGDYKKATAEATAGGAEILGNTVGFGVGDAAREAVRGGFKAVGGDAYEAEKSSLRQLGENAVDMAANAITPRRNAIKASTFKATPQIGG